MITDEQILVLLKVYYPRAYAPCQEEIELMRKALEAYEASRPKPEPIGYGLVIKGVLHATKGEAGSVGFVPLYTNPPTREPLSEDEMPVGRMAVNGVMLSPDCTTAFILGVRFAEHKHGIGATNA